MKYENWLLLPCWISGTRVIWIGDFSFTRWTWPWEDTKISLDIFPCSSSCSIGNVLRSKPKEQRNVVQCQRDRFRHAFQCWHFLVRFYCSRFTRNRDALRWPLTSTSVRWCRENWIHALRTSRSYLRCSSSFGTYGLPSPLRAVRVQKQKCNTK